VTIKTIYNRAIAFLSHAYGSTKGHVALSLGLALESFKERLRATAARSYGHYLAIVILFLLPTFCAWVLPVGLFVHLRRFVSEVIDDFRSIDLEDFTRRAWERNVRR